MRRERMSDSITRVAVVTGASREIGLEVARQSVPTPSPRTGWDKMATRCSRELIQRRWR
jgi:NAD(P)-dependent dehydrogenase (short-subunit alcohol dehydrogenase family)